MGFHSGGAEAPPPRQIGTIDLSSLSSDRGCVASEAARAVAVAVAEPLLGALVAVSSEQGRGLQLNQSLQVVAGQLGKQLTGGAAIQWPCEA